MLSNSFIVIYYDCGIVLEACRKCSLLCDSTSTGLKLHSILSVHLKEYSNNYISIPLYFQEIIDFKLLQCKRVENSKYKSTYFYVSLTRHVFLIVRALATQQPMLKL